MSRLQIDSLAAPAASAAARPVQNGSSDVIVWTGSSGDQGIDGLLSGQGWGNGAITYSFPNTTADYGAYHPEALTDFVPFTADQRRVVQFALNADSSTAAAGFAVEGFTNLSVSAAGAGTGTLRFANTTDPSTAYAYYPSNQSYGGDSFYGASGKNPVMGNYDWQTILHETGHALGLKHGQEYSAYGAMPSGLDAMEYTVMTYRSYQDGPLYGYTNEVNGFAQTYMMQDIAALQYMYGADFTTNSDATVYRWDPATGTTSVNGEAAITPAENRIFMTVWDGGGIDTYDLSAYTTGVTVNLAPGSFSLLSGAQQAYLGDGHFAKGNVYNARLYNDDPRSLIENAVGGSGNDRMRGNQADNALTGRGGDDVLWGDDGNDALDGGTGADTLSGGEGRDRLMGQAGVDALFGGGGDDLLVGGTGTDIDAILNGGTGQDTLSMAALTIGAVFDFAAGEVRAPGGTVLGSLASIEWFIGGRAGDRIVSDGQGHRFDGQAGDDTLVAGGGAATLIGGAGTDLLDATAITGLTVNLMNGATGIAGLTCGGFEDALLGAGDDDLTGTAGANWLRTGAGADVIRGGAGDDRLDAGAGNDRVYAGAGRDSVILGYGDDLFYDDAEGGTAGRDTVSGGYGRDRIFGGGGDDLLRGDAGDDSLRGGDGNDTLSGGTGRDTLIGGTGNDTYWIDAADTVWEATGAGTDLVCSAASVRLTAGVENLLLTGNAGLTGTGNALDNRITGNGGNNWLNGLTGRDTLAGGAGSDNYVTDGGDTIIEAAGAGFDTVRSSASLGLGANLEQLLLTGTAAINGTGNALDNRLVGNGAANRLIGGAGNDVLDGGAGNDILTGGIGADRLVFRAGHDRITDFADDSDTLLLDDALWGGTARSVAQVLGMAREVAGDVLFTFAGGHSLLVENVASKALLADDLILV